MAKSLLKGYEGQYEKIFVMAGRPAPEKPYHPLAFAELYQQVIAQCHNLEKEFQRFKAGQEMHAHRESPFRSNTSDLQLKIKSDVIAEQKEEISRLTSRILDLEKVRDEAENNYKLLEKKLKKLSLGCRALLAV
jgi:hypothetical protein